MKWDWVGTKEDSAGYLDLELCGETVTIKLSSFREASKLARLIRAELEASKLEGIQETINKY